MAKLTFDILEIPEGESKHEEILEPEDLELSEYEFLGGAIKMNFDRQPRFIRVNYKLQGRVELVCDRSLKPFEFPVETSYEVVFKTDVKEETATEEGAVRRFNFVNNSFSIEKEVRGSILLKIPIKKIHPDFLDEEGNVIEFEEKSYGKPPEDEEDPIDPRWDKLKEL